jgi:hypothetical protein
MSHQFAAFRARIRDIARIFAITVVALIAIGLAAGSGAFGQGDDDSNDACEGFPGYGGDDDDDD